MSFGLGHGRDLDDAPGVVGISREELPPLPDEAMTNPRAGLVDPRTWFRDPSMPLEIEIGSGKGTFLLEQAATRPTTNYLGIEWAREFYLYAADRIRRRGLPNVRMLNADATEFLRWRCPDAFAGVIHLYYSDPWPKKRHHKNRVVQDRFLADAWRILTPGGELRLVTDHPELWEWYEDFIGRWTRPCEPDAPQLIGRPGPAFEKRDFTPPEWVDDEHVIGTNYERKTRAAGREPRACVLRKC
ncbi:tRNA (guanine-N(7)-)-methyltransferase [Phycisphaerales bacterium]|nr:tRNA (guanine-N(7)-)-methyltransferase [Phycisphaerales bacterium]